MFSPFCERPWEVLNAFDVFVMPSINEGLPLTLAEAMACECCVIATKVGGVSEILSRPGLGWLVPPEDGLAFADAVTEAASSTSEERAARGRRARQHIVTNFDAAAQFGAFADAIESLANEAPKGAEQAESFRR